MNGWYEGSTMARFGCKLIHRLHFVNRCLIDYDELMRGKWEIRSMKLAVSDKFIDLN